MDYCLLEDLKDDIDIEKYVDEVVKYRIDFAKNVNESSCTFLGFNFSEIPSKYFDTNYRWFGFIGPDVKIGYGVYKDSYGSSDNGMYYYIDTNDYLYEFINYIKDKEVNNEATLVLLTFKFLDEYFGRKDFEFGNSRYKMYQYILDSNGRPFNPVTKHSLNDFKNQGVAECVERAVLAQNIFSFFGLESAVIYGTYTNSSTGSFSHAFNVISFDDTNYLVDMSSMVRNYDIDSYSNVLYPFTDTLTSTHMQDIENGKDISLNDYFMIEINGNNYYFNNGVERKYNFVKCKNIKN